VVNQSTSLEFDARENLGREFTHGHGLTAYYGLAGGTSVVNDSKGRVDSLNLLPESVGVIGFVVRAINQVLGYLVAYPPRLFLAAIIAAAWMGRTVHNRLDALESPFDASDEPSCPAEDTEMGRAA